MCWGSESKTFLVMSFGSHEGGRNISGLREIFWLSWLSYQVHFTTSVWKKYFMISIDFMYHKWVPGFLAAPPPAVLFFLVGVVEWLFWQTSLQGLVWRNFKKHFSPKKDVAGLYWSHTSNSRSLRGGWNCSFLGIWEYILRTFSCFFVVYSNLKGLFDPSCCIYQASSCKALLFEGSRGRIFGRLSMMALIIFCSTQHSGCQWFYLPVILLKPVD